MAIINVYKAPSDLEGKKEQAKARIKQKMSSQYRQLSSCLKSVYEDVWNNKDLSPQEVMDAFGSEAYELFTMSNSIIGVLNQAVPNSVNVEAPNEYVINNDGSVTIGAEKSDADKPDGMSAKSWFENFKSKFGF